jgi:molybdopterin biosynthesis enzyme
VITQDDIEKLKDAGNYIVFVEEGILEGVHEDEAALRMALASMGKNLTHTRPNKGRVDLISNISGILRVKEAAVKKVNVLDDFVMATLPDFYGVRKGQRVASMKIVPLSVTTSAMSEVEEILNSEKPVIEVLPPLVRRVGAIITGTEVYEGRIKDSFLPVLQKKLGDYGIEIEESAILPDDEEKIAEKIVEFKENGKELILVCGGMAVDAKDVTPNAIRLAGCTVIRRGVPAFPGSMMMIAYLNETPVLGLPACVIPDEKTTFDLILPKVLAGKKITREEIAEMGPRGLEILGGG